MRLIQYVALGLSGEERLWFAVFVAAATAFLLAGDGGLGLIGSVSGVVGLGARGVFRGFRAWRAESQRTDR